MWQASSGKSLWVAAAGVAFFAFYALIPMFAVLVLTYGLFVGSPRPGFLRLLPISRISSILMTISSGAGSGSGRNGVPVR